MESSSSLSCSDLFRYDGSAIPMPYSLKTYKIIGDNLDKNVKPSARDIRSDHWASEASPTLGCSIEISRDIYVCLYVGMSVVVQKA